MTHVAKTEAARQDRERRAAGAYKTGTLLYHTLSSKRFVWNNNLCGMSLHLYHLLLLSLGLKCYNQEPGGNTLVIECDLLGGANYCAKVTTPGGTKDARTCGIEMITDAFFNLGLTGSGCTSIAGHKFCLCSTSLCNWATNGCSKEIS